MRARSASLACCRRLVSVEEEDAAKVAAAASAAVEVEEEAVPVVTRAPAGMAMLGSGRPKYVP